MRRVFLMVFAAAMFMVLGSAGAMASSSSAGKSNEKRCSNPGGGNSKHGCKPCPAGQERHGSKCKPKPCPAGQTRHGSKCKPKPCPAGQVRGHDGKCKPKPCPEGQYRGQDGKCHPKPVECEDDEILVGGHCVPRPPAGSPCSKADLVLLEDLLAGTGGLLCVYFGENAPNADKELDCPDAALALPIDSLLGACLYLPPAEVDRGDGGGTPELPGIPGLPGLPELPGLPSPGGNPQDVLKDLLGILCGCASKV